MNVKQIVTGVLSGYVTKAVSLLASILVVPFLLDPDVLGVEDYGRAFSILGVVSVVGLFCAGIHMSADRSIARAVGHSGVDGEPSVSEVLGSTTKVLWLVNLLFAVPLVIFEEKVLSAVGIPLDPAYRWAVAAAVAISVSENAFYVFRAPLLARGEIAYVNLIGLLEVTGRTAMTFVLFSTVPATVAGLLGLQAFFTLARQIAFLFRLKQSDFSSIATVPISSAMESIRYAGPVSLAEGSVILVRNVPVMVASRFLGPTEAGYVAIVANTLQGYFLHIFYAVVQPIALPIASRFTLSDGDSSRRRWFLDMESAYTLGVTIVFAQLIYWTPAVIPLWLGKEFSIIVLPTQIMLAGSAIQTGAIIRRSALIGQGVIADAVPAIVGSALFSTVMVVVGVAVLQSWLAAIIFSAAYLIASSCLGVDRIFVRTFRGPEVQGALARLISVGSIFGSSILIGRMCSPESLFASIVWAVASFGASLALGFSTIISPRRSIRLAERLYLSRGVSLFD
jgi:O-antigen/teichoic acid export membrane protein